MNLTAWIATRYLFSRRVGRYAPLLTATAVAGVAIGMMALVIVMSVMRGFKQELSERLVGFDSHITIVRSPLADELAFPQVAEFFTGESVRDIAPFVQGEVIALSSSSGDLLAEGARVRGIEAGEMGAMEGLEYYFPGEKDFTGAVVGSEVASALKVHPDFEDKIELIAPLAELLPNGELGPNKREIKVAGVFRAGIFDYDSKYIFLPRAEAQRLLGLQAEEGWMIRLADADSVPSALATLRNKLPAGYSAVGWNEQNLRLFAALKLERIAMGAILLMVLLIASFSIVGVVLLVTSAKRKDIAILKSIGMTGSFIGKIFLAYASFIGAIGSSAGLFGGLAVCLLLKRWPVRLPDSYYLDWLPVDINFTAAILFATAGVVVAGISSVYPVKQAVKLDPVEVLRYE